MRRTVERMGTRINSVDPERVRVDGGKKADPALYLLEGTETLKKAQRAVESALGKEGWGLCAVLLHTERGSLWLAGTML